MSETFIQRYNPRERDLDLTLQERIVFSGRSKYAGEKLKNIPISYLMWVFTNNYQNNMIKMPELRIYIKSKLYGLDLDICIKHPECHCGIDSKMCFSKGKGRTYYNCSKTKYNKLTESYEGGCGFFMWGFPEKYDKKMEEYYFYNF